MYAVYYRKASRELQLLTQCDIVRSFSGLRESLLRLAYAYAIIECLVGLKREEAEAGTLLEGATGALAALESAPEDALEFELWKFILAALDDAGFRPELSVCVKCGVAMGGDEVRFDARSGGVACSRHGGGGLRLSGDARAVLADAAAGGRSGGLLGKQVMAEGREALRRFLAEYGLGRSPFHPIEELVRRRETKEE